MPQFIHALPGGKSQSSRAVYRNRILAALPAEELALVQPYLFRVSLVASQVIYESGVPPQVIYFVEQGFIALLADVGSGETIQIAMTGFEGARGVSLVMQPDLVTLYRSVVEIAGSAYRMQGADFLAVAAQAPVFRDLCVRHVKDFVRQIGQTSACNGRHDLHRRLCRLLLMVHDRSEGDDVLLTQGQIARMIGVRRAGVSTVMATLQDGALLRQARGRITILDRQGIKDLACECYAIMELP